MTHDSKIIQPGHDKEALPKRERARSAASQTPPDHRSIGTNQSLWTHHRSSPGSPLFLPAGAHIFTKLVDFLKAQYPAYGFQEVITPTLYKQSLWEKSGHWQNYKDNMFTVKGGDAVLDPGREDLGLKPMNCPGHCLLFACRRRSYNELPIRYADFSPLHRNEVSGALSGLTRVTKFHQDDGHIFCRPNQIQHEVGAQLKFLEMVYNVFGLQIHKVVLSTRPESEYIGDINDWESAEAQLKTALANAKMDWTINAGDGAFYGPKIDVIVRDSDEKEHQTATIQLDFQLPKRFELTYASEKEGIDEQPVMIHRAIFGSLERFMALLAEHYNGRWPFWLSPSQLMVVTVTDAPDLVAYAKKVAAYLRGGTPQVRQDLYSSSFSVHLDCSGDNIGRKIARAKHRNAVKYNVICVLGERNMSDNVLDLDLSGMEHLGNNEENMASVRVYFEFAKNEKGSTASTNFKASKKTSVPMSDARRLMEQWTRDYL